MKLFRLIALWIATCGVLVTGSLRAEDIDIYVANAGTTGLPNVLFVYDNGASFSSSQTHTCTYAGTSPAESPSLGQTAGGVQQCALYNVIEGLEAGTLNLGIMFYAANGGVDYLGNSCANEANGGCLAVPLTTMSATFKASLLKWIKGWTSSGSNGPLTDGVISPYNVKNNTQRTGALMQEAWAYYSGNTGLSGRSYSGSIQPSAGCQHNFVIFVANAVNAANSPGDGGSASVSGALSAAGASAEQLNPILDIDKGPYGAGNFSCGEYSNKSHTDSSGLYADEWARFIKSYDLYSGASQPEGVQGITTYAVGLLGPSCKPDYPALLTSMSQVYGGGKYIATSNYSELKTAIERILNEVQATNSVFASATLPVSVNSQGTYLNQIFLGMFRPDAYALPRWVGNLKQYQFALSYPDPTQPDPNTASLILADAQGMPAISSAKTGFIAPDAVSFWTYKDTANAPDDATTGGFYKNDSRGVGKVYDSADGEQVDKGGVGQQIRKLVLKADYPATSSTVTTEPRKVYTYCPSGSSCDGNLASVAANAFKVANTDITQAMLNSSGGIRVTSVARSGATVTVTTGAAHGFSNGDSVVIAGATPTAYNGTFAIANVTTTTFTYGITETPATIAGGGTANGVAIASNGVTRTPGSTTVTVTTSANHGLNVGDSVTIAGVVDSSAVAVAEYNGTFTVTNRGGVREFSFAILASLLKPSLTVTGTITATKQGNSDRVALINWVRGQDNFGDEKGPGSGVTVRPSVHGDVLHSRPVVINYGDSTRGTVVFYGSNDGQFHAVNGSQSTALGSVPAGGELWSLVLAEHYSKLARLRVNSPELKFPTTELATAQPKDYFVDGPTGVYQLLKTDGTIDKAILYLTMRRGNANDGSRFLYAIDVSTPTLPVVLWKISSSDSGFSGLGQTWSRPRVTLLQGYRNTGADTSVTLGNSGSVTIKANDFIPVLVFGGGYDPNQDVDPPSAADTQGRAVYVVHALTGALIQRFEPNCSNPTATCTSVAGLNYSIPSELTFVDRDNNGLTDKMYVGDMGGNVWRLDVSDAVPANWSMKRFAALGCDAGAPTGTPAAICSDGKAPRKLFFPPSVLMIGAIGGSGSYDAVMVGSGDREHPLESSAASTVQNRIFFLKDAGTAIGGSGATLDIAAFTSGGSATLVNASSFGTTTSYDGSLNGYYINLSAKEKSVNAPVTVYGATYFGTNKPTPLTAQQCSNLGEARSYALNPFSGQFSTNVFDGGGLPPSPVAGLVTLTYRDSNNEEHTLLRKFCIGCAGAPPASGGTPPPACNSALQNCLPAQGIVGSIKRTYWYTK